MAGHIYEWSLTAADNDDADATINWAEGQLPGTVNNSSRAEMSAVTSLVKDLGGTVTTGGSANAQTATMNVGFTAYATGRIIRVKAGFSNTGAATLNVNSIGAKAIKKYIVTGEADPGANDIRAGGIYDFSYDAAANSAAGAWMLLNPTLGTVTVTTGLFGDGTVAAPSVSFASDTDIGIYRIGPDQLGIAVGGTQIVHIRVSGPEISGTLAVSGTVFIGDGTVGVPAIVFSLDQDCGLYRTGANAWSLAAGGSQIVAIATSGIAVTGSISATGAATFNTFASSGVTITGGAINGTAIGGSTPAAGAFTTLSATGNSTLGDGTGSDTTTIKGETSNTAGTGVAFLATSSQNLWAFRVTTAGHLALDGEAAGWNHRLLLNRGNLGTTATLTVSEVSNTPGTGALNFSSGGELFGFRLGATGNFHFDVNFGSWSSALKVTRSDGSLDVESTTAASSTTTGALRVAGGAGIVGACYVGDLLSATGNFAINTNKFTVTAASGNTLVAGTFTVQGATVALASAAALSWASGNVTATHATGGILLASSGTIPTLTVKNTNATSTANGVNVHDELGADTLSMGYNNNTNEAYLWNFSNTPINIATNSTKRMSIEAPGNVVIGTAALATTATDGFFYIPTCAGAPTGNSTDYTGRLPMVFDTTNSKLWFNTTGTTWVGVVLS